MAFQLWKWMMTAKVHVEAERRRRIGSGRTFFGKTESSLGVGGRFEELEA